MLTIITPLITTPYVSRKLGAEGIGQYSFTASIVTYFTMVAALGTARYGQREISYSQDDYERRSCSFWKIETLSIVSTAICLIAYIIYVFIVNNNIILYSIQTVSIIAVAVDISWFFQGLEEFGRIVKRNVFFKIINIAFIFLAIHSKEDLSIYVLGICLITLLSNVSLWPYLRGNVRKLLKSDLYFKSILPEVLMLFVPSVAISIYTVLDKTMIGVITGSAFQNGYYEQSLKISRTALTIVTSLGIVMVPRIGHLYFEGKNELVREYMYKSYRFVWMIGIPLSLGLCAIANNLVPWFFGPGYDDVVPILQVSSFLIIAIGINNVTGVQYMIPTKRHNLFTLTVVIGATINFIMNYFLIRGYMATGAAGASVIAESVIAIVQLYIVRKELSLKLIFKSSIKYLVSGILMFVGLRFLSNYLSPSILHSLILMCIGSIIYFLLLIIMRDAFFLQQIASIKQFIESKVIKRF